VGEYAIRQASGVDTAQRVRLAESGLIVPTGTLTSRSGLFAGGAVTLAGGMGVAVDPLRAYIQGVSGSTQGGYLCVLDAAKTITLDDGSLAARTDIIVARIKDNPFDSSGAVSFAVEPVKGASGGGVPATPLNAIKLAEVPVPAGVTAGSGGLVTAPTDKRPPRLVASGGIVPVANQADRDSLRTYDGLTVYRGDTGTLETLMGGVWTALSRVGAVCRARNTSNQPLPVGDNVIQWDTPAIQDTDGMLTSPAGVHIPVSGTYRIAASAAVNTPSNGYLKFAIFINGTVEQVLDRQPGVLTSEPQMLHGYTERDFVADDTFTFHLYNGTSATRNFWGNTRYPTEFSIRRVS